MVKPRAPIFSTFPGVPVSGRTFTSIALTARAVDDRRGLADSVAV